jgi:hypothetical protein
MEFIFSALHEMVLEPEIMKYGDPLYIHTIKALHKRTLLCV